MYVEDIATSLSMTTGHDESSIIWLKPASWVERTRVGMWGCPPSLRPSFVYVCVGCPLSLRPSFDSAETFVLTHVMHVVTGQGRKALCAVILFCFVSVTGSLQPRLFLISRVTCASFEIII